MKKKTRKEEGIYLAKGVRAAGNTLIMGKGDVLNNLILPNMLDSKNEESFVIVDTDAKMYEQIFGRLKKEGYDVIYFNPEDENSLSYSPIRYFINSDDRKCLIEYLTTEIISESSCQHIKELILRSILLYMDKSPKYEHLYNIVEILNDYDNWLMEVDNMRCLGYLYNGEDELDKDIEFLNTISKYALDKALEELKEDLRFLCFERSKELTDNHKTIRIYTEFNKKSAVFICPSSTHTQYNFLCRMMLQRCVDECIKRKRVSSVNGNFTFPSFPKVNFFIQDINNMITTSNYLPYAWREEACSSNRYNMAFHIITDSIDYIGGWSSNVVCLIDNVLLFPYCDKYSYERIVGSEFNIKPKDIEYIPSDKVLVQIEGQECKLEEMLSI